MSQSCVMKSVILMGHLFFIGFCLMVEYHLVWESPMGRVAWPFVALLGMFLAYAVANTWHLGKSIYVEWVLGGKP